MWNDYKDQSKLVWGRSLSENEYLTIEEINTGCLLRIADSLEQIEQPYKDLLQDIEYYKEFEQENKKLKRTIAGLKGHINKLKKRE